MKSESLELTEAQCAEGRTAPRVKLDDIKAAIVRELYTPSDAFLPGDVPADPGLVDSLRMLTLCFLVMRNGFVIIGKAAPASPANYDYELGKKLAYEDAVKQIWPLMGYALRDRLLDQQNA